MPIRRRLFPALLLCAALVVPAAGLAATRTWSGLGADTNWTTAGNWDVLPVAGDDLVFPSGVPAGSLTNNNDFPALTSFNSITINGNSYVLNGNAITLGTAGIGGSGASSRINFNISIPATATLSMSTFMDIFGVISGAGGLTMAGSGTARLRGANTYTGASTVNTGSLSIEGTMLASSITVNAGGTLTGSNAGNMGPVTVNGGILDPGVSLNSAAIITINGSLSLSASSTFVEDIVGLFSPDRVAVNGTVDLGGSTFVLNNLFSPAIGDKFNIIPNDSNDPIVGTFKNLPEGSLIFSNGSFFQITYVGGDGNDVDLTVVTGPGTPTVTATPTLTPTSTGSITPTFTQTATPTATSTFTSTSTPTPTSTGSVTPTFTTTSTPTATNTSTATNTPTATATGSATATPTATATATVTPSPSPTGGVTPFTPTATFVAPTATTSPGGAAAVPTLSFPMLALLAIALGAAALLLMKRS